MRLFQLREGTEIQAGVQIAGEHFGLWNSAGNFVPEFFSAENLNRLDLYRSNPDRDQKLKIGAQQFAAPLCRPGKIICIGLNYKDHAEETGGNVPEEPIIFMKAPSALNGPFDPVILPRNSSQTDWEVELAVVIGKQAHYVAEEEALDYVLGYSIMVDYSEREYQKKRKGQWTKGKSCDTFAPLGPYIVTRDEVADPQNLSLWLKVNGDLRQDGSTRNMIFPVAFLVSYLSQFMSLLPGDIISTGTPAGVGLGRTPPEFLQPGDVVECGIEGLGEMRQEIIAFQE